MSLEGIGGAVLFRRDDTVAAVLREVGRWVREADTALGINLRPLGDVDRQILAAADETRLAGNTNMLYLGFDRPADPDGAVEGSVLVIFRFDHPGTVGMLLNFNLFDRTRDEVERLWQEARRIFLALTAAAQPDVAQLNGWDSDERMKTLLDVEDLDSQAAPRLLAPVNVFRDTILSPDDVAWVRGLPGVEATERGNAVTILAAASWLSPPPPELLQVKRWPSGGRLKYVRPKLPGKG